jgi:sulfatase modifying factor 1
MRKNSGMRYFTLTAILASAFLLLPSFISNDSNGVLNGFVAIQGSSPFGIQATEVSNRQYQLFIQALTKKGDTKALAIAIPKAAQWKKFGKDEQYYFGQERFLDYPVVNITRQAAEMYCAWLTELYNATASAKRTYRLPTEEEWMTAAKGGNANAIYPWEGTSVNYKNTGEYMANYKAPTLKEVSKEYPDAAFTAPVKSYIPNAFGVYNMAGNVAEITTGPGFTKGGHWNATADMLKIEAREKFAADIVPSPTTGFRPVYTEVK